MATGRLTPAKIMQLGTGFWGSKTLLSAIELGLFTELAKGSLDAAALTKRLQLHPRSARDFFDALVALGMLKRTGQRYANTAETALFLDRTNPSYVGGILEMCDARLYRFWGSLTEGLRTGKPQNEVKTGEDFFGTLYADPQRLEGFLKAMTGLSIGSARVIAKKFSWKKYSTFMDVGCAQGGVAVEIALAHKHLTGGVLRRPVASQQHRPDVEVTGLALELAVGLLDHTAALGARRRHRGESFFRNGPGLDALDQVPRHVFDVLHELLARQLGLLHLL